MSWGQKGQKGDYFHPFERENPRGEGINGGKGVDSLALSALSAPLPNPADQGEQA